MIVQKGSYPDIPCSLLTGSKINFLVQMPGDNKKIIQSPDARIWSPKSAHNFFASDHRQKT